MLGTPHPCAGTGGAWGPPLSFRAGGTWGAVDPLMVWGWRQLGGWGPPIIWGWRWMGWQGTPPSLVQGLEVPGDPSVVWGWRRMGRQGTPTPSFRGWRWMGGWGPPPGLGLEVDGGLRTPPHGLGLEVDGEAGAPPHPPSGPGGGWGAADPPIPVQGPEVDGGDGDPPPPAPPWSDTPSPPGGTFLPGRETIEAKGSTKGELCGGGGGTEETQTTFLQSHLEAYRAQAVTD